MKARLLATAGHVDHGKSTLVTALTGSDPDRLDEEKRRGLTIDLGFAHGTLPSGAVVSFVDVPGHVRFLKNMLAGVGAIEACLFVVDGSEGWKAQSEEHLRILDLLGYRAGVVALTKTDLVDAVHLDRTKADVEAQLVGSFLDGAPVVAVDAVTGRGLGELSIALDRLVGDLPAPADRGRPRIWIDRAFSVAGAGTVVTGTLTGGSLAVGDRLMLAPAVTPVTVRSLQVHNRPVDSASPGTRVAANLAGVHSKDVRRGQALIAPDQWHTTALIDARIDLIDTLDHPLTRRGDHVAYVGSGEYPTAVSVLGATAVEPGTSGLVRLRLSAELPLLPGDRFILRETGRAETVGGGQILDVDPRLAPGRARPDRSPARVVRERGWVRVDELSCLTGADPPPEIADWVIGDWVVDPETLATTQSRLHRAVEDAGPGGLVLTSLTEPERVALVGLADLDRRGGRARLAVHAQGLTTHPFLDALDATPFAPPAPDGVEPAVLAEWARQGLIERGDGIWFSHSSVARATDIVAALLTDRPAGITLAEVRDALGTSRRYALALLAILDDRAVTRRHGDRRVAGPRAPKASAAENAK